MQLNAVTAEIRPRSDWEAVDLGLAMVRRDFWRSITVWWLALGVPTLVGATLLWDHPLILLTLFWWFKPAGSRMVLFGLSRRLFGEIPSWRETWREIPRAWKRRFFYRFIWARFSPWMPVTLAVEDLENLRGGAYKQRCRQMVRRGGGVVMWLYFLADTASAWMGLAIFFLVMGFVPDGQDSLWQQAIDSWDSAFPLEIPLLLSRTVVACVMLGISLTDTFITGAGFGVYVNNRTWIEGWDVELAFKQLAHRLAGVMLVMFSFLMISHSANAGIEKEASALIQEVKAGDAFKIHTVTDRIPQLPPPRKTLLSFELLRGLANIWIVTVIGLSLALLAWIVWKNRFAFKLPGRLMKPVNQAPKAARVLMGMEVSPESLPRDVPMVAWKLWQEGRDHEALSLLYRGSISWMIELGRVEIQEADTEGECLQRVVQVGATVYPDYFKKITGAWMRMAYAGMSPADDEVRKFCGDWPFGEGRGL